MLPMPADITKNDIKNISTIRSLFNGLDLILEFNITKIAASIVRNNMIYAKSI